VGTTYFWLDLNILQFNIGCFGDRHVQEKI
jgi:hypothetical protein